MSSQSRIISVQSAKGGIGCSVIACNIAVTLFQQTKKPVLLLDFDVIHGGSQSALLNIEPEIAKEKNLKNLVQSDEISGDSLNENVIKHPSGVHVIPAETSEELESLSSIQVIQILAVAGNIYENIVVDLAQPYISEELLTTFDFSSLVCVVMTPDIITFEHTQKFLELMHDLGFPAKKFQLVLNMFGISSAELDVRTIQSYIEKKFYGQIPYDIEMMMSAVNTGVPILQHEENPSQQSSAGSLAAIIKMQNVTNTKIGKAFYLLSEGILEIKPTDLTKAVNTAQENAKRFSEPQTYPGYEGKEKISPNTDVKSLSRRKSPYGINMDDYKTIKTIVHRKLVSELNLDKLTQIDLNDLERKAELKAKISDRISKIFDEEEIDSLGRVERAELILDIANEALGLGPLEDLLMDPDITEILVNGIDRIYVEQRGKLSLVNRGFTDEKQLRVVIDRIVAPLGRRVDESSPYVDARLPDGSRVNIIIPPLSIDGASITIRKFPSKRLNINDYINYGTLSIEMAEFLAGCVAAKLNIFISGGTSSGKTTLLNILSSFIPVDERIVTIEDAAELNLHQDHVVRLEARPPNIEGKGEVNIRDLVRNSLRMRPDRIVVGEIRGGEALDMLQAMNTGHEGSLATGHANSPRDAVSRIETMVLMAGMELPIRAIREQIASAINIIVQQSRLRDGSRKIVKIVEVTGMESDIITMQDVFYFEQTGIDEQGYINGSFKVNEIRPKVLDSFEMRGVKIPSVFDPKNIISRLNKRSV